MQLSSSLATPLSIQVPAESTSVVHNDQQNVTGNRRPRRATSNVPKRDRSALPAIIKDVDVPLYFIQTMSDTKVGPGRNAFMKGYNTPSAVALPGYYAHMGETSLMRLALSQQITPEQLGALYRLSEQRLINDAHNDARVFTKVLTDSGTKVTPMPQGYYIAVINRLNEGDCAGITHILSLAAAEGKHQVFLGNIYQALAHPDEPESQAFFHKLAQVQSLTSTAAIAHDRATVTLAPYTTIAPRLTTSATTKTLLISADGHRLSAGVIVGANGDRTYYYNDPNIGFAAFSSKAAFEKGLKKIFTGPHLKHMHDPINQSATDPRYLISVFNPDHLPDIAPTVNDIRFMYDAPLSGLDNIKVIDATRVPTPQRFHLLAPAPVGAPLADYEEVSGRLERLHASKGMSQFHHATAVLQSVRQFLNNHPGSALLSPFKDLEQTLINLINEAAAPIDYPYSFERIEQQRAYLAEDKVGAVITLQTEVVQDTDVHLTGHANLDVSHYKLVTRAVEAALLKLKQSDPQTEKAVGPEINVTIANKGDQPETQLRLTNPPTLIIGDDFFAPVSTGGETVADRMGHQAQLNGDDAAAHKQAALLAGKFGVLGYYKTDAKEFLEMASNTSGLREDGPPLSKRANRSALDFITEAFTARLYDGKLDGHADATLNDLFSATGRASRTAAVPSPAPSPLPGTGGVTATPLLAPINEVEIKRLQQLDDASAPIQLGEEKLSRVELYKMGFSLDGQSIESPLAGDANGHTLAGAMHLDYRRFEAFLRSGDSDVIERATLVLTQIASARDPAASPMTSRRDGGTIPDSLNTSIRDTSRHAAALRQWVSSNKPLPTGFFAPQAAGKPGASHSAGLGFQAFSTFQGLRTAIESIQRGDTTAGAIGLGAVAADYASMGMEIGLNKVAQQVISRQAPAIAGFKASSMGKMIGKAAGGAGLVFSLPFDTYTAVDSFQKAGNSTGKEAQDHYVNGAFAVANAYTSIALGAAFMAGASAAGPAGIIVAGTLMAAQAIYSAVRTVEDIEKYTSLTGQQKFSLGLQSFLGDEPGFPILKPYLEAKYSEAYEAQSRERHAAFLNGAGKEHFERVVFGSADIKATQRLGKVGLVTSRWWSPITWILHEIKIPGLVPAVSVKRGNDHTSGTLNSWNGKPVNAVEGVPGEHKATLWDMGDGDDWVEGVKHKPNYFLLGGGKKGVNGGEADDKVVLSADARQTLEQAQQVAQTEDAGFSPRQNSLNGGGGSNTLMFSGPLSTSFKAAGQDKTARYAGHVINFTAHTISVKTEDSNTQGIKKIAHFQQFSNAATVPDGESLIHGDSQNNLFTLNGHKDVVFTGQGANVIVINGGATVTGEGGFNTYLINKDYRTVSINDPADSVVRLDYSAAQVSDWGVTPEGDLVVTLGGDTPQMRRLLRIKKAYPDDAADDKARPTFITNDGVLMTINAPRQAGSSLRIPQVSRMKVEAGKPQA